MKRSYVAALQAIVVREALKISGQYGRLLSALVRPTLWLAVFSAGFRDVLGVSVQAPYATYITYDVYILPGLLGMTLLFQGMQSSLALVFDREVGTLRLLLSAPFARPYLLFCKVLAGATLGVVQAYAFLAVAWIAGVDVPSVAWLTAAPAFLLGALCLGAVGLLLSVSIRRLENFAGAMNFVIFPAFFLSTAMFPLWRLRESGATWLSTAATLNPFTYVVEMIRFALYGQLAPFSTMIVAVTGAVAFSLAAIGYDPLRGALGRRTTEGA